MNNQDQEGALKKSIRGGKWVFINTIFQKLITFGSFLVLARLLLPEDFGTISILLITPSFLSLLTAFGFEYFLIQSKKEPEPYLNIIWTFKIIKSLVIFGIIFLSAPLIANFFHIEKAIWAVRFSGVFLLMSGFTNVAQLYFFKNIDFKKIFIRDLLGSIFYAIVSVSLALFYKSFWPLFFGNLAQHTSIMLSTYFLHEFRPRLNFQFSRLLSLLPYSKWIFGQNLVNRAIPMIENSLLGKLVGTDGVGLYSRAKSLATMPSAPFFNIINKVTFPTYSRIQESYDKIRNGFTKSLDVLFFITIPVAIFFVAASHRIILILLGEKWIEMDILLKILALAAIANVFTTIAGPIFNAIGKPKIQFGIGIINVVTLTISLFLLIPPYGLQGAVFAFLIATLITAIISLYKTTKLLGVKISSVIKQLSTPLLSSLTVFMLGKIILGQTVHINHFYFILLICFLGLFYVAFIVLFGIFLKTGPYKTLRLLISEIF